MYLYPILLNILYTLNVTFWNKELHAISLYLSLAIIYVCFWYLLFAEIYGSFS